jgi:hypothetical protein
LDVFEFKRRANLPSSQKEALPMKLLFLALLGMAAAPAAGQTPTPAPAVNGDFPETWFEIFRLAPGKHEEFVRRIALADEVSAAAGLPPTQLFFHEHGADFDVILFKPVSPAKITPQQEAAMAAKRKALGMRSGPAYYLGIRELIAEHTDSKTVGPVSAAQWLHRLDAWRAENPRAAKSGR